MKNLQAKKALITGAASGIGKALAFELASAGTHLALVDIDASGLEIVKKELEQYQVEILTIVSDIQHKTQIYQCCETIRQKWGELDILVNNAGVAYYGPTHRMAEEQWDWLMDINLRAPIHFVRELLPLLMDRPEAHVLNVCSIAGMVCTGRSTAYHVSKYGLVGFSEALRAEYGRKGIGVTALCPGAVKTNLYQKAVSGREKKAVPEPPSWICTSEKIVARKGVRGIRKNKRMVLVTPLAHFLYYLKRISPSGIDFMQQFSRSKIKSYFSSNSSKNKASKKTVDDHKKAA